MKDATEAPPNTVADRTLARYHVRTGWYLLAFFATLGLILESLHGLKVQWYVGVVNSTRREMFTLAHAHGTLLAVVHLGFAYTVMSFPSLHDNPRRTASRLLLCASVMIPAGFLLGGIVFYEGDPGLGILLVPVGAVCLICCALLTAASRPRRDLSEKTTVPNALRRRKR